MKKIIFFRLQRQKHVIQSCESLKGETQHEKNIFFALALVTALLFTSCPQSNKDKPSPPPENIKYVTATIENSVITISPATDDSTNQLKAALHAVVNNENRGSITKIIIETPANGAKITPEDDLSTLFHSFTSLQTIKGLENIDTLSVIYTNHMFQNCNSLASIEGISNWNTSRITNMSFMFRACSSLTRLNLTDWDVSSVKNMHTMFYDCTALTHLDLTNWDTSNVTSSLDMFSKCNSLTSASVIRDSSKVVEIESLILDLD